MIALRPYQLNAINETRTHILAGKRAPLIVAPTGAGKTTIAAAIVRGHVERGGQVLWVAHRRELVRQAGETLERSGVPAGYDGASPSAPTQIRSVQSMLARNEAPDATLVVFDEAHHYVADRWKSVADAFKASLRVGLSATPERKDGKGLGELFDALIVAAQIGDLIREGHLVACDLVKPVANLTGMKGIAQSPIDAYASHGAGRSTVVFANCVEAAENYTREFEGAGVPCGLVHGGIPKDVRDDVTRDFADGKIKVIVNVYVLTEGWDAPIASCAIFARKVGSPSLYLQMIGRILRPYPGKERALAIDLSGVTDLYGAPDVDRIFSLDGKAVRQAGELPDGITCIACGATIDEYPCEQCGCDGTGGGVHPPEELGIAIDKFAWFKDLDDTSRVGYLRKFILQGKVSGYRSGWAMYKYKSMFGQWPNAAQKKEAMG